MNEPTVSLCLLAEGNLSGLLGCAIGYVHERLTEVGGEIVVAGELTGISLAKEVRVVSAPKEASAGQRGRLRNLSIAQARGRIIVSGDATALLGPPDWPRKLIEWSRPIDARVPFLFGFTVHSPQGDRLWDWIRVSSENRITLVDYGEQVGGLSVGAGYIGMSRAAWELSGEFREETTGPGEEIEFTLRASREHKIPLVYCDALKAVRILEPRAVETVRASQPSQRATP